MKALIWFTKDLRIHDNPTLDWARKNSCDIMALVFEENVGSAGSKEFYLRSAMELKKKFQDHQIYFSILKGDPAEEIPKWMKLNSIDIVLTQDYFNSRDRDQLTKLEKSISPGKIKTFFGQTLLDIKELPFEISKLPDVFTEFRKKVESNMRIDNLLATSLNEMTSFIPRVPGDVKPFEVTGVEIQGNIPFDILPGESGGIDRLNEYFWLTQSLAHFKSTRNGMIEKNDSSKFSMSLGCGCLSPRLIFAKVKEFEAKFGTSESTKWFFYELLWRDYFKFLALKIGDKLFSINGITSQKKNWNEDLKSFQNWCLGQTGADFIDANMIELRKTGWMSNRGRQNVASYLAKTMNINWTLGANYFEQMLIDFDTESNWGNWIYVAGVGTDPRDRLFNYQKQAEMYDPDFSYRKKWLQVGE